MAILSSMKSQHFDRVLKLEEGNSSMRQVPVRVYGAGSDFATFTLYGENGSGALVGRRRRVRGREGICLVYGEIAFVTISLRARANIFALSLENRTERVNRWECEKESGKTGPD